jgi:hypothetical protein
VCDQETSKNEEVKTRYRAVENTTTMGCNAEKTKPSRCLRQRKISDIISEKSKELLKIAGKYVDYK